MARSSDNAAAQAAAPPKRRGRSMKWMNPGQVQLVRNARPIIEEHIDRALDTWFELTPTQRELFLASSPDFAWIYELTRRLTP